MKWNFRIISQIWFCWPEKKNDVDAAADDDDDVQLYSKGMIRFVVNHCRLSSFHLVIRYRHTNLRYRIETRIVTRKKRTRRSAHKQDVGKNIQINKLTQKI